MATEENALHVHGAQEPVEIGGFPRRNRLDFNTPAELAIRAAVAEVEKIGADVRLTSIVIALDAAREQLADFLESPPT